MTEIICNSLFISILPPLINREVHKHTLILPNTFTLSRNCYILISELQNAKSRLKSTGKE
jgi:hypothetical protein